jgi:hypothetical protein
MTLDEDTIGVTKDKLQELKDTINDVNASYLA